MSKTLTFDLTISKEITFNPLDKNLTIKSLSQHKLNEFKLGLNLTNFRTYVPIDIDSGFMEITAFVDFDYEILAKVNSSLLVETGYHTVIKDFQIMSDPSIENIRIEEARLDGVPYTIDIPENIKKRMVTKIKKEIKERLSKMTSLIEVIINNQK